MKPKRTKTPGLVQKLRFLCKSYPGDTALLKSHANTIMFTIKVLNVPPERWKSLGAYRNACAFHFRLTGDHWRGEDDQTA